MKRDNGQNSDEKIVMVPIVPADNDVFSESFNSLIDPAFKSTALASQEAKGSHKLVPAFMDSG